MLEKGHILIPENQCTSSDWFAGIIEFICMFDPGWTQQLQPGDFTKKSEAITPLHHFPADYCEFLLYAGKSGCKFQTPLLRHRYFSITKMEKYCEEYESEQPWIYRAFAALDDEYESSFFTFGNENSQIQCRAKYPGHPIASGFRHLFCCSAFLDFGIRQFIHRMGFVAERNPEPFDIVQTADFTDLLKKRKFVKQWFRPCLKNKGCTKG